MVQGKASSASSSPLKTICRDRDSSFRRMIVLFLLLLFCLSEINGVGKKKKEKKKKGKATPSLTFLRVARPWRK